MALSAESISAGIVGDRLLSRCCNNLQRKRHPRQWVPERRPVPDFGRPIPGRGSETCIFLTCSILNVGLPAKDAFFKIQQPFSNFSGRVDEVRLFSDSENQMFAWKIKERLRSETSHALVKKL